MPPVLSEFLSLPKVEVRHVPGLGEFLGLDPHVSIVPLLAVLPMWWGLSLFLTQLAHEHQAEQAGIDPGDFIIDRAVFRPLSDSNARLAIYVGNDLTVGQNCRAVASCASLLNSRLDVMNLLAREHTDTKTCIDDVGLAFGGDRHEVRMFW